MRRFTNMITSRVRCDESVEYEGDYLLSRIGKVWRVYMDGSYYSQTSGGVTVRGKVLRGLDDKPISFTSIEAARSWVRGGCQLTDSKGNEF